MAGRAIGRREFLKGVAASGVIVGLGGLALTGEGCVKKGKVVTASATAQGHGGPITVTLGVNDGTGKIVSCDIVGDDETPGVGGRAVEEMPAKIVSAGNLSVDGIAGATMSSMAIISAATTAYTEAMGSSSIQAIMAPGTYDGHSDSYWLGYTTPVKVTVDRDSILSIELPKPEDRFRHGETSVMLKACIERLVPRIIQNQSIAVDAVTGATVTSSSIKSGVRMALLAALKAGGSQEAAIQKFMAAPKKSEGETTERLECDVLVVGLGGGGILAMKSALDQINRLSTKPLSDGRVSIIGIDKAGKVGGKTAHAHAGLAINPPKYKAKFNQGRDYTNRNDFESKYLQYLTRSDGSMAGKPEVVKAWIDATGPAIDFMYDNGFRFGTLEKGAFIDGINIWDIAPAPSDPGTFEDRRLLYDGYARGILASVVAQGGRCLLETEAYEYITEGGRVAGVKARDLVTGKQYTILAKAVIQATGGFGDSQELIDKWLQPKQAGPRVFFDLGTDDGKMIKAAVAAGAGTWNIDSPPMTGETVSTYTMLHKYPAIVDSAENPELYRISGRPKAWSLNDIPYGIGCDATCMNVDKDGKLFWSTVYNTATGALNTFRPQTTVTGNYFYTILSNKQLDSFRDKGFLYTKWKNWGNRYGEFPAKTPVPEIYEVVDAALSVKNYMYKGDTIEALAKQIGIDPAVLKKTLETYNGYCKTGVDPQFGKPKNCLVDLGDSGPYYAVKLSNRAFATCGGLDVDAQMRVLKADHVTPIEGLYAIGVDSLGVIINNEVGYSGFMGSAQSWSRTGGYIAGAAAVTYVRDKLGLSVSSVAMAYSKPK
ncbi:MAG: FAD-binding protein [Coriobacteriia bacterium]|nr:FAD-binding protein [Coriobacteriia bacterium]